MPLLLILDAAPPGSAGSALVRRLQLFLGALSGLSLVGFLLGLACVLLLLALVWRSRRAYLGLPELTPPDPAEIPGPGDSAEPSTPGQSWDDHIVIVPARNDATAIARAVASFPASLVCVVVAGSTDSTAAAAAHAGANVVAAEPCPRGWSVRNHACWTGALCSESRWLLFADPGSWYEPEFTPALLAYAQAHHLKAVSVFPRLHFGSLAARLLGPYALGLFFAGVHPQRVNALGAPDSLAASSCLLIQRSAYRFLGGHRTVAASAVPEIQLAAALKRHRIPLHTLRCERLAHARLYASFAALWHGFRRNAERLLLTPIRRQLLALCVALAGALWLPPALLLLFSGLWPVAALLYLLAVLAWAPWYRYRPAVLLVPIAGWAFLALAAAAMVRHYSQPRGVRRTRISLSR